MKSAALLVLPVGILAHLPFVIPQMQWMWNSTHYGFFPFAIAAFVWLMWERLKETKVQPAVYVSRQTTVLLLLNVLLLAVATLARSNWLGWVSFLLFLWNATHILLPPEVARRVRQPFLVLLLIVPLPLSLDSSLVIQLQKLATRQGSLLLDFVSVPHAVTGVAVRLPEKTFLVNDACSGIHSLFSAVTAMLVFSVYCRYSAFRTCLTLLHTVFWVLVVNSMRVFVIVYTSNRWNLGLDAGMRHEALGFACYVAILALALSTDQALRYLARIPTEEDLQRRSRRVTLWQQMSEWFDRPFPEAVARMMGIAFAVMFLAMGSFATAQTMKATASATPENFDESLDYPFVLEDMPETVDGWTRVSFKPETREAGDVLGVTSFIWSYQKDGLVAQFSIDGAYPEFHDLWYCYSSLDWELLDSANIDVDGRVNETDDAIATQLQLYKGASEQALVLFTCVDATGKVVEPPDASDSPWRRFKNRIESVLSGKLFSEDENSFVPPVIQFQVYVNSNSDLYGLEPVEIQKLFAQLRETASQRLQEFTNS